MHHPAMTGLCLQEVTVFGKHLTRVWPRILTSPAARLTETLSSADAPILSAGSGLGRNESS